MRRTLLALLFALAFPLGAGGQELYRWTGDQGDVHFTDDPESIPPKYRALSEKTRGADLDEVRSTEASSPSRKPGVSAAEGAGSFAINPLADVRDLARAYRPDYARDFVKGVLTRRFPFGWALVSMAGEACMNPHLPSTKTSELVATEHSTVVHECGHGADEGGKLVFEPERSQTCGVPSGSTGESVRRVRDPVPYRPVGQPGLRLSALSAGRCTCTRRCRAPTTLRGGRRRAW